MALVGAAAGADDLGADHAVAGVADIFEVIGGIRRGEARPAGAALELSAGHEQGQAAQAAGVSAGPLFIEEDAAERRLGAMLEQHVPLLVAEVGFEPPAVGVAWWSQVEPAHPCAPVLVA